MKGTIPGWLFRLSLFLGALFTVLFGWAVKNTLEGGNQTGRLGQIAVAIAAFPDLAQQVFTDVRVDAIDTDEPVSVPRPMIDLSGFRPVSSKHGFALDGLLVRADDAALARSAGWRVLVGPFSIDGRLQNAAVALSPALEAVKVWTLTEEETDGRQPQPPHRKFVHGLDVMSDGSVIFAFDNGISLQRVDACGERVWSTGGNFHHAVTLDDTEEFVWTVTHTSLVKVATATGSVVQSISMGDIIDANPGIDILEIRQADADDLGGNSRNTYERWAYDPFHLNDVDPLPRAFAAAYEDFEAGDLAVSARSLNLVFVLSPETLEVKWWRIGSTRRQHDPDWSSDGVLTVFDNRLGRDYSRIIGMNPATYESEVLFDGRANAFYTRIRGKHQVTGAGNILITSSQQGRIIEVDQSGRTVLEIVNVKPGAEGVAYSLSDAIWFPAETFDFQKDASLCAN